MATTNVFAGAGSSLMKTARAVREEARRERFLDAKRRTIGVDKDALDAAVREHEEAKAASSAAEKAYAEYVGKICEIAEQNEREAMQDKIDAEVEQLAHWRLQADRTLRPEWDLNDPAALKKDRPARVGDDDPRCGPSSMQKFAGEDLDKKDRDAMNMRRQLDGIEEQLAQHRRAKAAEAAADREFFEYESALLEDLRVAELERERDELRERLRVSYENKMLARARKVREREEAEAAKRAELDEVRAARTSDMLSESRILAYNYADPRRVRRDHFKGMSQEQLAAIQAEQEAQRRELAERRAAAAREDKEWAERVKAQVAAAAAADAEADRERVDAQREYYLALKAQQRAAKLAAKGIKAEYTNRIDGAYFDKWNQTMHN